MNITMEQMREWYGELTSEEAEAHIERLKENKVVFDCLCGGDKSLLDFALKNKVGTVLGTTGWTIAKSSFHPCKFHTYRLSPDVTLSDGYRRVFVEAGNIYGIAGMYFFRSPNEAVQVVLGVASSVNGYICIEAVDEAGVTWYLPAWAPYASQCFRSIEKFVARAFCGDKAVGDPQGRLTPVSVIFEEV